MAGLLREKLNVDVAIEPGHFGEFSVYAGEQVLTQRKLPFLPSDDEILESVKNYLNGSAKDAAQ